MVFKKLTYKAIIEGKKPEIDEMDNLELPN